MCDTFLLVDFNPQRDRPFFGELRRDTLGEARFSKVTSVGGVVTRSSRHIGHAGADVLCLKVQLTGHSLFSQDGREAVLRPGDFALLDGTRPFKLTYEGNFAQIVLQMPRAALLHRLGATENFTATRIDGNVGVGGVLSPMLRVLPLHLAEIPDATRERIAGNVLDLMATALLANGEEARVPARMTLVRAKAWIEMHLSEELSAECIAARCNLSVRHINRLFAREGTSLMYYVWGRRLARCHRDLTDPAMRHRPIGEIAFAAGFNDLSHFSRAYRAHYGNAPGDARRAMLATLHHVSGAALSTWGAHRPSAWMFA
ncbi:MAG: helix-turn-helix domain-containing protein [Verrucomicrobia subdivision 3 bacterium]|nr:helix-turn-helix domain-containing protein [Limisphaerales bacterium]